jgi:hypothetical protein
MIITLSAAAILFPILIMIQAIPSDLQSLYCALAQNSSTQNAIYQYLPIPTTISNEAQEELRNTVLDPSMLKAPDPDDLNGWKRQYHDFESMLMALSQPIIDLYQPDISEIMLDGIQILDIKPQNWTDNGKVLVYAQEDILLVVLTRLLVVLFWPLMLQVLESCLLIIQSHLFSKWNQTTDQIVSIIQMLKEQLGYSGDDIAVYGDSAGGGLVTGSILKMRDQGLELPAALVLWSPWLDLTETGDTYFTLKYADQYLSYDSFLKNTAGAYVDHADQKNPYVSPVYGNFTGGFTPTLIQGGTREIFLSGFIRFYQALDQADIPVKLDIYEGMPHVHQYLYKTPESKIALSKMNEFLKTYLDY